MHPGLRVRVRHTTERGSERERILEGRLVSKIWKEVGNDRTASFVWRGLAGRGSGGESQVDSQKRREAVEERKVIRGGY